MKKFIVFYLQLMGVALIATILLALLISFIEWNPIFLKLWLLPGAAIRGYFATSALVILFIYLLAKKEL